MDIRKLQRAIVDGLEDVKAQDIQVFNTEHLSPLFERVIVASGTSNRQTKSLAASVRDSVRTKGFSVMRTEGEENGEWIIVDCGAAVVHVMQPAIRQYYHLEELWGGKVVKMKFGDVKPGLVKAAEPDKPKRAPSSQRTGSKPAAAGSAARKAPAKTAARKSASARVGSPKPAPARKSAGTASAAPKRAAAPSAVRAPARTAAKPAPRSSGSGVVSRPTAKKSAPAKKTTRRA